MEPRVRIHDPDDRHVRKVEPLRDHLGAEQDVDLALGHARQHPVMGPFGARRVEVHARDARFRESQAHEMLELLRPQTPHPLGFRAAGAARGGDRLFVSAVVAPQGRRRLVDGQRDRAAGTIAHIPAGGTLEIRREPAPIQEQDHLFFTLERPADGLVERLAPRHSPSFRYAGRAAEIDDRHGRQWPRADAVGQLEAGDASRRGKA